MNDYVVFNVGGKERSFKIGDLKHIELDRVDAFVSQVIKEHLTFGESSRDVCQPYIMDKVSEVADKINKLESDVKKDYSKYCDEHRYWHLEELMDQQTFTNKRKERVAKVRDNTTLVILSALYHYWHQFVLTNSSKELDYEKVKSFHELYDSLAEKFDGLKPENVDKYFSKNGWSSALDFAYSKEFKNICLGLPQKTRTELGTVKLGPTKAERFGLIVSSIFFPFLFLLYFKLKNRIKERNRGLKAEAKEAMFRDEVKLENLSEDLKKRKSVSQFLAGKEQSEQQSDAPEQLENNDIQIQ